METKFISVTIEDEELLVDYIDGTSSLSEKHAEETTSLNEIKRRILDAANNDFDLIRHHGIQVECMKGWDKVHVFNYEGRIEWKELIVSYEGTMK